MLDIRYLHRVHICTPKFWSSANAGAMGREDECLHLGLRCVSKSRIKWLYVRCLFFNHLCRRTSIVCALVDHVKRDRRESVREEAHTLSHHLKYRPQVPNMKLNNVNNNVKKWGEGRVASQTLRERRPKFASHHTPAITIYLPSPDLKRVFLMHKNNQPLPKVHRP